MKANYLIIQIEKKRTLVQLLVLLFVQFIFAVNLSAQITVVNSQTKAAANAASVAITKPTGLSVGDLMIANITNRGTGSDPSTVPSGWTKVKSYQVASTGRWAYISYKVATATDIAAASFTFGWGTTNQTGIAAGITAFRGVNTNTGGGIEVNGSSASGTNNTISAPAISTLTDNALVLFIAQISNPGTTFTAGNWTTGASVMTQAYTIYSTSDPSAGLAYIKKTTTGTTSNGSKAISASTRWGGMLLALLPAKQFRSLSSGNWNSTATWQQSTDGGTTWVNATTTPTNGDVSVNIRNGHTVTVTANQSSPVLTVENGGILKNGGFTITLGDGDNFTVSNGGTFELSGTSTMVTVSGTGSKTFGASSQVNYIGSNQTVSNDAYGDLALTGSGTKTLGATVTISGNLYISGTLAALNAGTTYNVSTLTLGTFGKNAGTWGSTSSSATNKDNTYFTGTTGKLNVTTDTRPLLTISATGPEKVYGTALTTGSSSNDFTVSGLINGNTVTSVTLTPNSAGTATTTAAGSSYMVTPSAATGGGGFLAGNYNITYNAYTGSVSQAALTITANNVNKTYGQAITLSSLEFTTSGLVNNDVVNSVTFTTGGLAANAVVAGSPFTIALSSATGTGLSNYSISYVNGSLTVLPAALTISGITASNKIYDGTTAVTINGTPFYIGLQNSESFSVVGSAIAAFSDESAGEKTVTISGYAAPSGNYTITQPVLNATISPAPLTITATDVFKSYFTILVSPATGILDFNAEGLMGNETIGSVTMIYSGTGPTLFASTGTYPNSATPTAATGGTFQESNYSITYVPGNIVVGNARYAVANGNWNSTSTWSFFSGGPGGSSVPGPNDFVFISEGYSSRTVTIPSGYNAVCTKLIIGSNNTSNAGTLNFTSATSTLTVNGIVQMNKPNNTATSAINLNAGTLTVSGDVRLANGNTATNNDRINLITISTGKLSVGGDLVLSSRSSDGLQSQVVFSGAGTLEIGGNFYITNGYGVLTPATSTVNFNSTNNAQTIPIGISTITFNNVIVNSTGDGASISGPVTGTYIKGNLSIQSGSFSNNDNSITLASGRNFSVSNGATFNLMGSSTMVTVSGGGTKTFGATSNTNYSGNTQTITAETYGNLNLSGGAIKTMPGSVISVQGNFSISDANTSTTAGAAINTAGSVTIGSGATFISGAFTHTVGANWTNNGTFIANGSTIDFNGSNVASISAGNFNHITFSGAGTKSATGALTITGNVTISNNFTAGSFTHSVSGNWNKNGTFNATNSTIDFNGNSSATINAGNFNHITFSGAGTKSATGALTITGDVTISNNFTAGNFIHTVSGNWTNNGTLTAGTSTIILSGSAAQNIGGSTVTAFSTLTIANTTQPVTTTANLTASGILTINANSILTPGVSNTIGGTGTLTGNGTVKVTRTIATADFNSQYPITNKTLTGLTVDFSGAGNQIINTLNYSNLTISNNGTRTVTLNNSGIIGISGIFSPTDTTTTYIVTGSTVDFNGTTNQQIPAFSYHHLVLGGSNTKTANGAVTVNGNLTVNSNFTAGSFSHVLAGNLVNNGTINAATGTFVFNNTSSISGTAVTTLNNITISGSLTLQTDLNITGNWINNGTFIPNTSTVGFTNGLVPVPGMLYGGIARKQNFYNLVINKPGQTVITTSLDTLTLSGTIILEAGNFSVSTTQIILNQGNWVNNGGSFTAGNSTLYFRNKTVDQFISGTVATQSFANMTIDKNGTKLAMGGNTVTLNIGGELNLLSGTLAPANGTTVAYNKQGAQNIPILNYHHLTLSGSGSKTVTNGNLLVNATLTIDNDAELNMGTNQLQIGNSFAVNGNGKLRTQNTSASPLPDGITWSFNILYDGVAEQTINTGIFDGGIELNNSNGAKLKGNTTIGAVTLTAGDLSIDSNTLVLKGSFNGSVNNALKGSRKSNLTINEANTAGTLYFKNAGTGNYLRRFTFGANASATLGNRLHITSGADAGSVTVKSSSKLISSGNLVLQSDSLGTAWVSEIEGCTSCTAIEGEVEVERFIPAKRTWRFITIPVTGNYTLRQQLVRQQNGAAVEYPAPYCAGSGLPAPAATGYGTLITANSMSSCSNAASMGADLIINGSSSSVRFYTHINGTGSWASASNTPNFNAVPNQDGYLVFVRGDRSQLNTTEGSTTFRFKGQLKQGNKTNSTTISATYGVMSNPYAAPIDLDHVYNNGEGNNTKFERNFWIWDGDKTAGVNSLGGYRSISFDGAGNYDCADCEGISVDSFLRVNSGQAFMVQRKASNTASSVSMTVKETDKTGNRGNISSFRVTGTQGAAIPKFRVQLYRATGTVMEGFMDGALVRFGAGYSAGTNEPYDIYKYNNFDENISLVRGSSYLSIESRPLPTATDTIFLPFWNTTARGYALRFQTENFGNTGQTAILVDQFTNTRTVVPLNGTTVVYPFSVTTAAASKSLSRFYVVFTPPQSSLPVTFTQVKATPQSNGIKVEWDVANEEDLASYEVERSNDGVSFSKIGSKAPLNQQKAVTYQWFDANPFDGTNYYRIKSVDLDGTYHYSTTVRVTLDNKTGGIRVFPTIVTQQNVTLEIKNQPQGLYKVNLTTTTGQIIYSSSIHYTGGIASRSIEFGKQMLAAGTYFLVLTDEAGNKQTFKLLVN